MIKTTREKGGTNSIFGDMLDLNGQRNEKIYEIYICFFIVKKFILMVDLKNRNNLVVSTGPYTSFTDLVEFFPIKYDYLGSFQTIFLTYVSRK